VCGSSPRACLSGRVPRFTLDRKAEVDELFARWKAGQAKIVSEPEDKTWKLREHQQLLLMYHGPTAERDRRPAHAALREDFLRMCGLCASRAAGALHSGTEGPKVRTNSMALLSQTPHFHNREESASCECGGGKNNHKTFLPAKHRYQTKDERVVAAIIAIKGATGARFGTPSLSRRVVSCASGM
jgi:predicted dienelactone hydrolase